ncbi:hypothetical protein PYW08_006844 [Mythimna loreyi]|uniref:Uncharacterized protein n=1 Tax=Mythimna loreyi TaxID=667449 RepID=A0ACC2RAK0_9NEOP|nr:hypothetical protein PYW08_006844 [Mythimna loreyi]
MIKSEIPQLDTFLYFAYAGNMVRFRIKTFCPTAEFVSIARLDNFRLGFMRLSKFWEGPVATMVPTANAHIWGVIWRIHKSDMESLDNQKDVNIKKYFVKYVQVHTPHMGTFTCRSYMQKVYPLPRGNKDPIPVEQWPSWAYKQFIIIGAKENGLPLYYIRFLRKLKDNGNEGSIRADCLLRRYGKDIPCDCRLPVIILREPLKLNVKRIRSMKQILNK